MSTYQIPSIPSTVHGALDYVREEKSFLSANKCPGIFVCVSRAGFESPLQHLTVWPWTRCFASVILISACENEGNSCEN